MPQLQEYTIESGLPSLTESQQVLDDLSWDQIEVCKDLGS